MAVRVNSVFLRRTFTLLTVLCISVVYAIAWKYYPSYLAIDPSKKNVNEISFIRPDRDEETQALPGKELDILCEKVDTNDTSKMTSPEYSTINAATMKNGDVIIVSIKAYDIFSRPKTRGDDVIVIWAVEKNGDGRVSGDVIDHKNGVYTGIVQSFWSGPTEIKAWLVSSIVNTCLRINAIKKYGNVVFAMQQGWGIRGTFKNQQTNESMPCGANPTIFGYEQICDMTRINGNMSWYCGRPKSKELGCSNIFSFGAGEFDTKSVREHEIIQHHGHGLFNASASVIVSSAINQEANVSCKYRSPAMSWADKTPSGYWRDGVWHMTGCKNKAMKTFKDYKSCLSGKTIVIVGDSTLREYGEFIVKEIMDIKRPFVQHMVGVNGAYHTSDDSFKAHGITLRYLKHEMPFHNAGFTSSGIISLPQILDSLALENISDLIVLANYNSHFTAYPTSVYRNRQKVLKEAFKRLNVANPSAKLFVKRPHLVIDDTRWFDPHIQLVNAEILAEEFMDMRDKVVLLDCWTTSVTHTTSALHPRGNVLQSQIQQFLSYIC